MRTPDGDDGVDDSAFTRCPHGVLEDEYCDECVIEDFDPDAEAKYDPDADNDFRRENPAREDD